MKENFAVSKKIIALSFLFQLSLSGSEVFGQSTGAVFNVTRSPLLTTITAVNKKNKNFTNLMSASLSAAEKSIPEIFDINDFDGKLSKAELTYFSANTNLEIFQVNANIRLVSKCGSSQNRFVFSIGSGVKPKNINDGHQSGDLSFMMDKLGRAFNYTYLASVNFGHAYLQIEDYAKKRKYFLDSLSSKLFYYVATKGKIYPRVEQGFLVDSAVDYAWTGSAYENLKSQFELLMKKDKEKTPAPMNKGHMQLKGFNDLNSPENTIEFPLVATKVAGEMSDVNTIQETVKTFAAAHPGKKLGVCDLLEGIQLN